MKVVFYGNNGNRDSQLAAALSTGVTKCGDIWWRAVTIREFDGIIPETDVVVCQGLRMETRLILDAYKRAGAKTLFFDKGYWDRNRLTRWAINGVTPFEYLMTMPRNGSRLKLRLAPFARKFDGKVLYAAMTQMYHEFYAMGEGTAVDGPIMELLLSQNRWTRPVYYRPRPGYADIYAGGWMSVAGSAISTASLAEEFKHCYQVVTLASNVAVEALQAGIPTLVLGEHPARLLNSALPREGSTADITTWTDARQDFLEKLSWCQWTFDELMNGSAWTYMKRMLVGQ